MNKPTKARLIHQQIADDIVHGRLLPGTALDETSIAATFGVSRTPIREAIRQLEAIGLVEGRAQRGAVVAGMSERQLDEMFAVMAELEALCARWSAVAMTAGERRQLLTLQQESERLVSAGRRDAYVEFNSRFHEAIYRGTHNAFLAELTLSVRKRCAPFRRAQFETLGRLAKSHAEHDAVVIAIERGDAEAAMAKMRAHIVVVRSAVDEVAGAVQGRANASLAAGYGFTGILVAFLAKQNPIAIIPVAIFLGGIAAAGGLVQRRMGLPDATVQVLLGLMFVILLVSDTLYGRFKIFGGKGGA